MTDLSVSPPEDTGTLDEAIDYLYRLPRGSKPVGLLRAEEFFRQLGSPQDAVRTVHVAGTAGKGSVSAFVASILTAHGFQVGTHVSPHVRTILERFQIGGAPISPLEFIKTVRDLAPTINAVAATQLGTPTFFEATNAVAFSQFASGRLDYAVVETGVGGLFDATNTISRRDKLAVITQIGIDHVRLLGDTTVKIAAHKAGILPVDGHAIVLRHHEARVRTTISQAAQSKHCRTYVVDPRAISCSVDPAGTVLHVDDATYPLGLQGHHQGINAILALHATRYLADRDGWRLTPEAIRKGLAQTWLPGRFERHTVAGRDVILDGAHNNVKLIALVETVRACYPGRRATWVLAAKADKDLQSVLTAITPIAASVVGTQLPEVRACPVAPCIPATAVAEQARARGLPAFAVADPAVAVEIALNLNAGPIVVTGSFLHLSAADRTLTTDIAR
ncbi:folylpolyglutamate synthase/dihydrofolate synthase [Mycobacteroides abscessus subsp. bolletii]|uniref:bifunctional folylpolyglutamate synthase/dihydrofolate synthase n=1 Tax=Mycobacteroides abscessus TaxID=36809 RepID=UPI0009A8BD0D|nr:Mur ligase family protein [Mycobacteroides abscessus]SLI24200.1 folylpolyglutamate synthase/dihydrofolate synthase [Mycobacteroides abscessus subsp. bolletii]